MILGMNNGKLSYENYVQFIISGYRMSRVNKIIIYIIIIVWFFIVTNFKISLREISVQD